MKGICFADSGGFYARSSKRDRSASAVARLADFATIVTTQLVVIETVSLLTRRESIRDALAFDDHFRQASFEIVE